MQGSIDKMESLAKGNSKIVFIEWDRERIRANGTSKYIGASLISYIPLVSNIPCYI